MEECIQNISKTAIETKHRPFKYKYLMHLISRNKRLKRSENPFTTQAKSVYIFSSQHKLRACTHFRGENLFTTQAKNFIILSAKYFILKQNCLSKIPTAIRFISYLKIKFKLKKIEDKQAIHEQKWRPLTL